MKTGSSQRCQQGQSHSWCACSRQGRTDAQVNASHSGWTTVLGCGLGNLSPQATQCELRFVHLTYIDHYTPAAAGAGAGAHNGWQRA